MAVVLGGAACGGEDAASPPVPSPDPAPARRAAWGPFDEGVLVVQVAEEVLAWCVLVADAPDEWSEGLMDAPDADLGGYDGMAFVWGEDTTGGFWMKDTEVPLSLAYVGADGSVVSTVDMDPCPPGTARCPSYPPSGPYRLAVEVPQGELADLGIEPGATVQLDDRSCPAG